MPPGMDGLAAENFDFAPKGDEGIEYIRHESENIEGQLEREHAARTRNIELHLAFHGL